ncbi:hypothetical protein CONPUDRAFT_169110 [Coniophora puteana RWD-64-598 SS2]|uniref:Uncharacterized protein n=1 Tax=Coniophora puteana (strain RWD-64-598) TaxID=741705 RepID=A0A5M3M9E2_CONPW|nr:uncharacterized protein CONPUDRAFT_169110 [Coniophora puteana RWD-64-598 SS2]EIW75858.1 hypothetical protein CONPUDRAFT_169110 [Coniophora puteana RWD-64-598 SS2]
MPASSLPPELLEIIFEECILRAHNHDGLSWQFHVCVSRCILDWVQVTHVCRHWRTVALGCPRLWSHPVVACGRWAEEMLARSRRARLTLSVRLDGDGDKQWKQSLKNAKQLVIQAPFRLLVPLIGEISEQITSSGSASELESLSLAQRFFTKGSTELPIGIHLVSVAGLRRLHLGPFNFDFSKSLFEDMSNLRDLSLRSCLRRLTGDKEKQIHLLNLARLHLIDDIDDCKDFIASLHYSHPLEYLGLRDVQEPLETTKLLFAAHEIINRHHVLGETMQLESVAPIDLTEHRCAVGVALSTQHTQAGRSMFKFDYNLAAWPTTAIHPTEIATLCKAGLFRIIPSSDISPYTTSALLDSNPSLFIGGLWQTFRMFNRPLDILAGLYRSFSLRTVVCAVIADSVSPASFTCDALSALFSELPSLQYLEMANVDLACLVDAFSPSSDTHAGDSGVPLSKLVELVLSASERIATPETGLALCLRSRAGRGSPLQKLCIRGQVGLSSKEWAMLRELPMTIVQDDGP